MKVLFMLGVGDLHVYLKISLLSIMLVVMNTTIPNRIVHLLKRLGFIINPILEW